MDACAVKVGPFHPDNIAAALAGVVQSHANKFQVPRAIPLECLDDFLGPNEMTSPSC
jgi:homoserine kinase